MNCFDQGESIEYEEIPCCDNPKIELQFRPIHFPGRMYLEIEHVLKHICTNCGSNRPELD